jgi:hypothetical protein
MSLNQWLRIVVNLNAVQPFDIYSVAPLGKNLDRKTNPSLRIIGKASKQGDILVPKRRCGDFRRLEMQVLLLKSTPPSFADQIRGRLFPFGEIFPF